jgi:hypothetical protein
MVPGDQVKDALARGARLAIHMIGPDGSHAAVPAESAVQALKAGARPADPTEFARLSVQGPAVVPDALQPYSAISDETLPAVGLGAVPMSAQTAERAIDSYVHAPAGAAKGLASTSYNVARLGSMAVPGVQTLPPKPDLLNPAPNEKVGYGVEQAAEFAVPGAVTGDIGKGLSLIPRMATRAALEGAGATAVSAAHGDEHPLLTGAVGAAGGAASEGLETAAPWIQEHATKLYSRALNPTTGANKVLTQKVVPELIDQGEWGTLKTLVNKSEDVKGSVGPAIDATLTARGATPVNAQSVINDLEDFKNGFKSSNGTVLNPSAVDAADTLQRQIVDMGSGGAVTTADLVKARRIWDNVAARAGAYTGADVAQGSMADAMTEGASSIRKTLAADNPDLAALNQQYSFWSNVGRVADATLKRRAGQLGGIPGNGVAEMAGAIADGAAGGAKAAGWNLARKAYTSTASRTGRAVLWGKLGAAIEAGNFTTASKIARTLAPAGTSAAQSKENQ